MIHKTVLLNESIDILDIKPNDVFVDGTLGNGGHSEEVIKRFGDRIKIFAFDMDSDAIERSKERLSKYKADIKYINANFKDIKDCLLKEGISKVDKVLLDIGFSSNQIEESGRGFSFQRDEPLVMSFKKDIKEDDFTAYKIVNFWDEDTIRTILKHYGEEKFAGRIAKGIVRTRVLSPINTTTDLVNVVLASTPKFYHRGKIHPATRTFQALRITVNDELTNIGEGLTNIFDLLNIGGRCSVISFHSLEDRIVKDFVKTMDQSGFGKRLSKKPIVPDSKEISENPRSRSAKMRAIEKLKEIE